MEMPDLFAPVKREAGNYLRYVRSRSRLGLHLVLDAILSITIVLSAFHFFMDGSDSANADTLKLSGATAMSGGELVSFLHHEKLTAYWAGPRDGAKYTVIATTPGEVTITYFPRNADITQLRTSSLVIQTQHFFSASDTGVYAEDISGPGDLLLNQGSDGNAIYYDPATPTRATLTFKNHVETVTIFNPTPQASLSLAMRPGVIQQID